MRKIIQRKIIPSSSKPTEPKRIILSWDALKSERIIEPIYAVLTRTTSSKERSVKVSHRIQMSRTGRFQYRIAISVIELEVACGLRLTQESRPKGGGYLGIGGRNDYL